MSLESPTVKERPEFNLTSISTFNHLIVMAITCITLWGIIVATISS